MVAKPAGRGRGHGQTHSPGLETQGMSVSREGASVSIPVSEVALPLT